MLKGADESVNLCWGGGGGEVGFTDHFDGNGEKMPNHESGSCK